ncbi:hypothetical protein [Salinibacter altiplanensis]|uniref:hypothetical protein n=1 Tax=Salinibacter altiplanensis TaxID=1803181 RepID=UPI001319E7D3|nr:hypothetical protein [Salinibacter altiplanensis]
MIDKNTAERALEKARTPASRQHLYQRLSSPEWISPLKELGEFSNPPSTVEKEDYRRYPNWPQADYLLRMAEETDSPDVYEEITQVLEDLPAVDNDRVYLQSTKVALELPADMAVRWSGKVHKWLQDRSRIPLLNADPFGDLAVHLAQGGCGSQSLYFMREVIAVFPDSRSEEEMPFGRPTPQTRIPQLYDLVIEEYIPPLVELTGRKALDLLLIPLLDDAIRYSVQDSNEVRDFSYIRRPKIEEAKRFGTEPQEILTSALIDAVTTLTDEDPRRTPDFVRLLENQDPLWPTFQRIALFLLQQYPDEAQDIVVEHVLDSDLLNDFTIEREYAMLVGTVVDDLSSAQRDEFIGNILDGPKADPPDEDDESSVAKYERFVEHWRWRRLGLVKDYLTGSALDCYNELEREYGDPSDYYEQDEPEGATWVGPTSPKGPDELAEMAAEEVLDYLGEWTPSEEPRSPSPEGLSRVLSNTVAANPGEYAPLANLFRGLDPTYVKGFISGLEETEESFDWEPVLALCRWVVTRPKVPSSPQFEEPQTMGADPDWGGTRKRIASLIRRVGLGGREAPIPFEFREEVWSVLDPLTHDPDPQPGENQHGDPYTHSINAVRSESLHAVIEYAWWVRQHVIEESKKGEPTSNGFELMPEVREVLEPHLHPNEDASLAVRSVYGRWYPRLYYIDCEWTSERRDEIFPEAKDHQPWFEAAWNAYLFAHQPYSDIFESLRPKYELALRKMEEGADFDLRHEKNLAEHLIAFYSRGLIEEPGGLISDFLIVASEDLRRHAVWWIGQRMEYWYFESSEEKKELLGRLRRFWEARIEAARNSASPQAYMDELSVFGGWFLSGQFEEEYALRRLTETLEITHWTRKYREVLARLADLSEEFPAMALRCLQHLASARGTKTVSFHGEAEESARKILEVALANSGSDLADEAQDVLDLLLARELFQFRDMISEM